MKLLQEIFIPFGSLTKVQKAILLFIQLVIIGTLMQISKNNNVPHPIDIIKTFCDFLSSASFYDDFLATFMFVMTGMVYSMLITCILVYLRPILFFTPFVDFITRCRYLTFSTVLVFFTFMVSGGNVSTLKMILLLFGTVPFFAHSFVNDTKIGEGVPEYHLQKAYVNRLNRWEALLEIIIIGKADKLFKAVKDNFAIAWAVITTVEANAMNEGGIGTMITKANKHMVIGQLFAIMVMVILFGILFDFLFGSLRKLLFPYVK